MVIKFWSYFKPANTKLETFPKVVSANLGYLLEFLEYMRNSWLAKKGCAPLR
jgi:hypothetical protein